MPKLILSTQREEIVIDEGVDGCGLIRGFGRIGLPQMTYLGGLSGYLGEVIILWNFGSKQVSFYLLLNPLASLINEPHGRTVKWQL